MYKRAALGALQLLAEAYGSPVELELVNQSFCEEPAVPTVKVAVPLIGATAWVVPTNEAGDSFEIKSRATRSSNSLECCAVGLSTVYDELHTIWISAGRWDKYLPEEILKLHGVDTRMARYWADKWSSVMSDEFCEFYLQGKEIFPSNQKHMQIDDPGLTYFGRTDELFFYGVNK
jgi:hypothetical protein